MSRSLSLLLCVGPLAGPTAALAQGQGQLSVIVDRPVAVLVDGQIAPFTKGSTTAQMTGLFGRHEVIIRNLRNQDLWSGTVEVPNQYDVRCRWESRAFDCYEAAPLPVVSTPLVVVDGLPGFRVVVREPTTVATEAAPCRVEPVPDRVELVVRNTDGEWADVLVDGQVVIEFRNDREASVWIPPGVHTVEVRGFLEDQAYARGRLSTDHQHRVTLGITENSPVTCYDHDGWQRL